MKVDEGLTGLLSPTLELDEQAKEQIRDDVWRDRGMFQPALEPESIIESFVRVGYSREQVTVFVWAEWDDRRDVQNW